MTAFKVKSPIFKPRITVVNIFISSVVHNVCPEVMIKIFSRK